MTICDDLRQSVLQAAIQGKLTQQLPEDGSAEDLLASIKFEKDKLIAEKKIKKDSIEALEDVPFDIPTSWCWVRLNDIVVKTVKRGKSPTYTTKSNTLVFAQKCNTKAGYINMELALFLDEGKLNKYPDDEFMQDMDIVINSTGNGTLGRVGFFRNTDNPRELRIVPDSHVTVIRPSSQMNATYAMYCMKYYQPYFEKTCTGSTNQTELSVDTIKNLAFPLPPLAEQHRIVARVNELMAKIDELEVVEKELVALKKAFPGDMKDALLQAAMQGKLTQQLPEDGSAADLLASIKAEKEQLIKEKKIKKEKPLAPISADEIPFDIPDNWEWIRLGDGFHVIMGQAPDGDSVYPKYDNGKEFHQGKIFFTDEMIGESNVCCDCPKKIAPRDSALLCVRAPIGTVNITNREIGIGRGLAAVVPLASVSVRFLLYLLRSQTDSFISQGTGSTFKAITANVVLNQVVPIPPLAEQQRIVEKLDKLLPLCDALSEEGVA